MNSPIFVPTMKATCIDYSDTHSFSETLLSYISRDPKLEPYLSYWPDLENFGKLIGDKKETVNRDVLVKALRKQYSGPQYNTPESKLVLENIESLSRSDTFTITTGHQLNIFTGPLYFIFKIVTAINLASELKAAHPDKHFVPVYWMATEDHDFAEINHTNLHGLKFSWDEEVSGATGRINPASIRDTLKAYVNALGYTEHSEKLKAILEEAYLKQDTLANATRFLVHSLFAGYGLLILDADDTDLKREFSEIVKQDILEQRSHKAITKTSEELEELGFETQVYAREINFFYLKDNLRERIVFENGRWEVLNTEISFGKHELIAEIDDHPERFSPNVVMRPLYQEVILPNLAYIGGGAEIVYWLQLKQSFEQFGVDFPVLILRNSALIANESLGHKLSNLTIPLKDIFKPAEIVKKEYVIQNSGHNLHLNEEWEEFSALFEKIKLRAHSIDPTLAPSSEGVKAKLRNALDNLEKKFIKAEKRNHEVALRQIENLRNTYFPGDSLQERTENFGLLYTRFGDNFIAELIHHFKPLDLKFTVLEY
ncbi:bacillithiol biosynthesis cysteine-adding enzyme BshC [Pedobacter sp. P351]|uniref:bacillithiol biosynthesis cysteine-adding enzyme BshC n=1 Tax=Pedobacter superstes TaxID=3133441 RepID=UPI00309D5BAE